MIPFSYKKHPIERYQSDDQNVLNNRASGWSHHYFSNQSSDNSSNASTSLTPQTPKKRREEGGSTISVNNMLTISPTVPASKAFQTALPLTELPVGVRSCRSFIGADPSNGGSGDYGAARVWGRSERSLGEAKGRSSEEKKYNLLFSLLPSDPLREGEEKMPAGEEKMPALNSGNAPPSARRSDYQIEKTDRPTTYRLMSDVRTKQKRSEHMSHASSG